MQRDFKEMMNEAEINLLLVTEGCSREGAFLSYYFIKFEEPRKSLPYIKYSSEALSDFHDALYWLWIVGEYANQTADLSVLTEFSDHIAFAIEQLQSAWMKPQKHWLNDAEQGIFISNIAMVYGAYLALNNHYANEGIQQQLKAIRKFLFDKLIKGGRIVSKLGDRQIQGDIILTAVPFGMLGIEDRILIEALNVVEDELVTKGVRFSNSDSYYGGCERADLSLMLAWYYSEKGDLVRAKQLLGQVKSQFEQDSDGKLYEVDRESAKEELYNQYWLERNNGTVPESKLSYILYAITERNLSNRLVNSGHNASQAIRFIHQPTGSDDPYFTANFERAPRYPQQNESVVLNVVIEPLNALQLVSVEWSLNGKQQLPARMKLIQAADGDKIWQADLGSFQYGDKVEYAFEVVQDGGDSRSEAYEFKVRKWQSLRRVVSVFADEDTIQLEFEPLAPNGTIPTLLVTKQKEANFRLSFQINGNTRGSKLQDFTGNIVKLQHGSLSFEVKIDESGCQLFGLNDRGVIWESYFSHGSSFAEVLTDGSGAIYKIRTNFKQKNDEKWFGMGERYAQLQFRGHEVDNYVYNQYRDQQLKTYIPSPFAISSAGYGIYLDTLSYSTFKFGTTLNDLLEIEADVNSDKCGLDVYLISGKPLDVIRQYTDITGKPMLPPKWSFGPWMSSNNWDSQAETVKQVELTEKYQIPATVIVLEQWSDEATFYIFNDAQYEMKDGSSHLTYEDFDFPEWGRWPDPQQMVEFLHESGLKVLLWQIPIHKHMYGVPHVQKDADEKTMLGSGYHVKMSNGEPYRIPYNWFKDSLVIDFSNPDAQTWWFDKRKYLLEDIGVDGFKTDGGECIFGKDLSFFDGTAADEMRNRYPNDYISSYYDFVQQYVKGGGITFSRAGYVGSQKFPLHWAGDERSTFEAFRASIIAGLSCSMSGIPFWGWDLAGFHGDIPTAELFIRSTQMAAFCPVMQYHAESKGEFNQDRTPWNIAERTASPFVIEQYKKFADLRMNLLPYIYEQAVTCSKWGFPLMRAMFIEYPTDPSCQELKEQYLFGDSLLVAPVVYEGASTKQVYFPEGKWLSLFANDEVAGSQMLIWKAALGEIPVFMKENSILPLNLDQTYQLCSHVGNRVDQYDQLCFVIYMTERVDYHFTDDLHNTVHFLAVHQTGEISVQLEKNYDRAVTMIFRKMEKAAVGIIGSEDEFAEVYNPKELKKNSFCQDSGNLYVQLYQNELNFKIQLVNE